MILPKSKDNPLTTDFRLGKVGVRKGAHMTNADRIIEKCGGVKRVAELVGQSENWVYRWRLPVERGGTGGRVPQKAQRKLIEAASLGLVDLAPADFFGEAA